jgi:hypothetical protein
MEGEKFEREPEYQEFYDENWTKYHTGEQCLEAFISAKYRPIFAEHKKMYDAIDE